MKKPLITLIKSGLSRQGGLEKYTWQLAYDFCLQGAPVTLLTTGNPTPPFSHPLLTLISFPIHRCFSFLNVAAFDQACADFLLKHPTPIVFSLDRSRFQTHIRAGNGVHAAYLKRRSQEEGWMKKLSFTLNPLHHKILSLEKRSFEHPLLQKLFTNSHMVKEEILQFYQINSQKIEVVHNGVEWKEMHIPFSHWEEGKMQILSRFNLSSDAYHLLFIGHNFYRKGLDKLLYALAELPHEHFQLTVIGKEKNLSSFHRLIRRLNLSEKVFILGPQKTIYPFYQLADCVCIPSLYDPFANVTVEALAMGVFVLSSRQNGGHEVLTPLNGAIIASLEDTSSFAALLKNRIDHPKTHKNALAIRHSIQHLDFSNQLRLITEPIINSNF